MYSYWQEMEMKKSKAGKRLENSAVSCGVVQGGGGGGGGATTYSLAQGNGE